MTNGNEEYTDHVLQNNQEVILNTSDVNESFNKAESRSLELLEKWTKRGSGWVVDRVQTLWLNIANYQPFKGESFIKLPKRFKDKQFGVNIQNKDDTCLPWAKVTALYPPSDKNTKLFLQSINLLP